MSETGWVWDERFLRHATGEGHPERPARLAAIDAEMRRRGLLDRVVRIPIAPAEIESIALIHDREYIRRVEKTCARGEPFIDTVDSAICSESYEIALLAAGGVLAACDVVMAGGARNAFAADCEREVGECLRELRKRPGPSLLHVKIKSALPKELGRPTVKPHEVKERFMDFLNKGAV